MNNINNEECSSEEQRKSKWFVVNLLRIFAVLQLFFSVIAFVTAVGNIEGIDFEGLIANGKQILYNEN